MNNEDIKPIIVKFPLTGEWCAVNTPGESVPSHGTDALGQTYAYDFIQIDWNKEGFVFCDKPSVLFGTQLKDCYGWSQPICAPFDGKVIEVFDGVEERNPVHIVRDLAVAIENGFFLKANNNVDLKSVLGNFIILKGDGFYSLMAHARRHSILVSAGDMIKEGQPLAKVGHSGTSTIPHLHFQLMDSPELLKAKGLPCSFKDMHEYKEGEWCQVNNYIPGRRVRVRA